MLLEVLLIVLKFQFRKTVASQHFPFTEVHLPLSALSFFLLAKHWIEVLDFNI